MADKPTIKRLQEKPPTLEEAQEYVGGMVELVTCPDGTQLICNEDGIAHNLLINVEATDLSGIHIIRGNVLHLKGKGKWT